MRCKNCGTHNDDNRYICENCGSPLYDEEDFKETANLDNTQTFNTVNPDTNSLDLGYTPEISNDNSDKDPKDKKNIIAIAILAVVLVAVIISVIVVAQTKKAQTENASSSSKISDTISSEQDNNRLSTQAPSSTNSTTESTSKETTSKQTTTQAQTWYINAGTAGGGSVTGAGEYKNGDTVKLVATIGEGYTFDGWYSDGVKVSSNTTYTFTANENASFSAVFDVVEFDDSNDDNTPDDDEIENIFGGID